VSENWLLGPSVKRLSIAGGAMLYNAALTRNFNPLWFEPGFWAQRGELAGTARGRGTTHFVRSAGHDWVLRHYRRGGLLARLSEDRYLWRDEERTRPFAEWALTHRLHRAGLPVPVPVAARYVRHGRVYRGDIITERLAPTWSLVEALRIDALSLLTWVSIGRCIRRFHDLGVCHADLNAHNVLLGEDSVHLVDFDRCRLRADGLWRDANLVRLRRSLEKIAYGLPAERFTEADWHALLSGYRQPSLQPADAAAQRT
jgi:3-deoxy-D-manno-octulosonic acid kinase